MVAAILVMNRTLHTNDVVPRIEREVEKINSDGSLPPGVKVVPFYDRTSLVNVTTHTVLHNLIFGCAAGFPHPVGVPRRPAQRHHRRRQHSVRAVLQHHHSRADERGRQPPVGRRRRLRNHRRFRGHPGGERVPQFPGETGAAPGAVAKSRRGALGPRPDQDRRLRRRPCERVDRPDAPDPDQRDGGRHRRVLLGGDHGRRLRAAVHHAGRRRADLQPDGPHLRLRARRRAVRDLHHHPGAGVDTASRAHRGDRDHRGAGAAPDLLPCPALLAHPSQADGRRSGSASSSSRPCWRRGSGRNSCRRSRKAICGSGRRCRPPSRWKLRCPPSTGCARS